jgi:hypothetical protein
MARMTEVIGSTGIPPFRADGLRLRSTYSIGGFMVEIKRNSIKKSRKEKSSGAACIRSIMASIGSGGPRS